MSTELAEMPQTTTVLAIPRANAMREFLKEQTQIRSIVNEFIARNMVRDVDYGVIPGTKNETLLVDGAEKVAELFNCTPVFTVTTRLEDWDVRLWHYEFSCKFIHRASGDVMAQGVGSCNSRENRYRYRKSKRKCPACGAEAIIKGKEEFGGGWLCWKKEDGCGQKFQDGDQEIESQESGQVENDDIESQINTILKMAKKRSLVDCSVVLLRRFGFRYGQDMEDVHDNHAAEKPPKKAAAAKKQTTENPDIAARKKLNAFMVAEMFRWHDTANQKMMEEILGKPLPQWESLTAADCAKLLDGLPNMLYKSIAASAAAINEIAKTLGKLGLTWPTVRKEFAKTCGWSEDIDSITSLTIQQAANLQKLLDTELAREKKA